MSSVETNLNRLIAKIQQQQYNKHSDIATRGIGVRKSADVFSISGEIMYQANYYYMTVRSDKFEPYQLII